MFLFVMFSACSFLIGMSMLFAVVVQVFQAYFVWCLLLAAIFIFLCFLHSPTSLYTSQLLKRVFIFMRATIIDCLPRVACLILYAYTHLHTCRISNIYSFKN